MSLIEELRAQVQQQERQLRAVAGILAAAITYVSYDDADDWNVEILEYGTPSALTASLMRALALTEQNAPALLQAQEQLVMTALQCAQEPSSGFDVAHRARLLKWRAQRFNELLAAHTTPPHVIPLPPQPQPSSVAKTPEIDPELHF